MGKLLREWAILAAQIFLVISLLAALFSGIAYGIWWAALVNTVAGVLAFAAVVSLAAAAIVVFGNEG